MSEIKVNKISPRTACGTTTLGDSGDSFVIPSGVTITNNGTQTGFGRSGSVNWQTSIKTTNFTAASGEGYFCDTSSGAFTLTLPSSPSVGDIVALKDYASSFDSQNLTIGRGGSNMNGAAADSVRSTKNESLTLVYADATKGWLAVEEGTGFVGETFIEATGGTATESGNFKIHTFTGPGTFTVSALSDSSPNNVVDYLVVGGGGSGGFGVRNYQSGGGGGAGGYRESPGTATGCYSVSPRGASPAVALPVSVQGYPIAVGAGGATSTEPANSTQSGSSSSFSTITSAGGGGGGIYPANGIGVAGASGGGGGSRNTPSPGSHTVGGAGNTPSVTPAQGTDGGDGNATAYGSGNPHNGGGGGGATVAGTDATGPQSGPGGTGGTSSINGTPTQRSGGGGGGSQKDTVGAATGGGGAGGLNGDGNAGTANTGGGGGGGGQGPSGAEADGGAGGSGIVIIRYKFQ